MKNSWYYRFLGVVVLLVVVVNLQAQSNDFLQNSDLQRKGFKLAIDTPNETKSMIVLEKEQLQMLLSDKQFRSYNHAHDCFAASIPLLALGASYFTISAILFGGWLYDEYVQQHSLFDLSLFISRITFAISIPLLVPGVVLIVKCTKILNNIAEDYNKQRHSSYFQNGLQVNFGLVDNGIGVKLRF